MSAQVQIALGILDKVACLKHIPRVEDQLTLLSRLGYWLIHKFQHGIRAHMTSHPIDDPGTKSIFLGGGGLLFPIDISLSDVHIFDNNYIEEKKRQNKALKMP